MATRSCLTLNQENGRWHVGDHELHAGDYVELELPDGGQVVVRFEWQHHAERPPSGYFVLRLLQGEVRFDVPPGAVARMPR